MKIGIANDHRGYILKKQIKLYLESLGHTVVDYGTDNDDAVDYPVYAFKLGEGINNKEVERGILVCGTGIGMSIAANKVKNIRCAKVDNVDETVLTRQDNDANIIALGYKTNIELVKEIVSAFISTEASTEERHQRRIKLIENYENER